jgi:putative ABC transport system substrate-binding protein
MTQAIRLLLCSLFVALPAWAADPEVVLVLMAESDNLRDFRDTFVDEVSGDFRVQVVDPGKKARDTDVERLMTEHQPALVVLVDNPMRDLYRSYQQARPEAAVVPSVVVMSLFLEDHLSELRGATGIAYEVPAVTTFVRLRQLVSRDLKRVGVVHRPGMAPFVARQAALAELEGVDLVAVEVPEKGPPGAVKKALRTMLADVDGLWVLNDNVLLRRETLDYGWLPALAGAEIPVIVGVRSLVDAEARFGNFAVLPDHEALGLQTADLVYELADADWDVTEVPVQQPVSVQTALHVAYAREKLGLVDEGEQLVDLPVP